MLIAMAPFRRLRPGEASQVLAPISGAILIDRRKALELAIPDSGWSVVAWLILFWKAAASGWRSYSVGQAAEVGVQPDFPIQERAFILRALLSPALRCLGPREPDLARGNIAFQPALQFAAKPVSDRLKVLLVSPFLPYPLSHGGAVRMYNLCRELCGQVDFYLIALREKNDEVQYEKLHELFQQVHILDRDEVASQDENLPMQVREHESPSLRALITSLCESIRPDLVQFEYTHLAAFRECAAGIPSILVEHDVTFSLYRQLAESRPSKAAQAEYARWLTFETGWLKAHDAVWTVSEDDRRLAIAESGRRADRTFTIPNGVDIARFFPCDEATAEPELLYVGSFRHLPNVIGFERALHEIMPLVWGRFPKARLRVVAGSDHESFWRESDALDTRVELNGFVEDLRPLYARASVVMVPLEVSAGTNIKVLEAMACGKAVVSTPIGCAGLGIQEGVDLVSSSGWPSFASAVCDLLSNEESRTAMGAAARTFAVERYSWTKIAESAYQSYTALVSVPQRIGSREQSPRVSALTTSLSA